MAIRFISDLVGTLQSYFKIGAAGPRLKNSTGVLEVRNTGDTAYAQANASVIGIAGSNASNKVSLQAPAGLSGNVTITFPGASSSPGQFLGATDSSGTLGWASAASNGASVHSDTFTQATSSPYTIFTPPANARITRCVLSVGSAAAGGSPTASIGVAGTVEREMAAADCDLKTVGTYETTPLTDCGGSPAAVILTLTPDSQTFSGTIFIEYVVPTTG